MLNISSGLWVSLVFGLVVLVMSPPMASDAVASEQSVIHITPSQALATALRAKPKGEGLGVKLVRGRHTVYVVRLKVGGAVQRVFVDAQTGAVINR